MKTLIVLTTMFFIEAKASMAEDVCEYALENAITLYDIDQWIDDEVEFTSLQCGEDKSTLLDLAIESESEIEVIHTLEDMGLNRGSVVNFPSDDHEDSSKRGTYSQYGMVFGDANFRGHEIKFGYSNETWIHSNDFSVSWGEGELEPVDSSTGARAVFSQVSFDLGDIQLSNIIPLNYMRFNKDSFFVQTDLAYNMGFSLLNANIEGHDTVISGENPSENDLTDWDWYGNVSLLGEMGVRLKGHDIILGGRVGYRHSENLDTDNSFWVENFEDGFNNRDFRYTTYLRWNLK